MTHLVLVSCSKTKLPQAAPARDLYCSSLFRASRAYAEAFGDRWAILSAKHGVVLPETVLEPYDVRGSVQLANGVWKTQAEYDRWLVEAIHGWACRGSFPWRLTVLAGKDYTRCLSRLACDLSLPLEGMQVGERLRWLQGMVAAAEVMA